MQVNNLANKTKGQTNWNTINWFKVNRQVRNLRRRIFKASQEGNSQKVKNLQKLMLRSYSNTLQSVRKVTQVNAGKNTAGVDKVLVKTSDARSKLVADMTTYQPWKAQPTRRVYIPKANGKQRPLGIPTISDRVMQARVKNALEPQWEARFEAISYGFRPGRSAHDAQALIWNNMRSRIKPWVVDADIKGAFDNIDHNLLLDQIKDFPAKGLVREWLKAGYMENGIQHATITGTPQGGIVSPLLANIALHGLEESLSIKRNKRGHLARQTRVLIRYADDFVIMCESEEDAHKALQETKQFLSKRGLEVSEEKTRIVHINDGFDFLGFNFHSYKDINRKTGYITLIKPSKESIKKLMTRLKKEWMKLRGKPITRVLQRLNPIIRGWANYFRHVVSAETFRKLDNWMFRRQVRYAKFMHPHKGWKWIVNKYWGRLNPSYKSPWVFGDKEGKGYLLRFGWTKIRRHIIVRGTASVDDPKLDSYWKQRKERQQKVANLEKGQLSRAKYQNFTCPVCGETLLNGEELQVHHIITNRNDPQRDELRFQKLVHLYCHQQLHSQKEIMTVRGLLK